MDGQPDGGAIDGCPGNLVLAVRGDQQMIPSVEVVLAAIGELENGFSFDEQHPLILVRVVPAGSG